MQLDRENYGVYEQGIDSEITLNKVGELDKAATAFSQTVNNDPFNAKVGLSFNPPLGDGAKARINMNLGLNDIGISIGGSDKNNNGGEGYISLAAGQGLILKLGYRSYVQESENIRTVNYYEGKLPAGAALVLLATKNVKLASLFTGSNVPEWVFQGA